MHAANQPPPNLSRSPRIQVHSPRTPTLACSRWPWPDHGRGLRPGLVVASMLDQGALGSRPAGSAAFDLRAEQSVNVKHVSGPPPPPKVATMGPRRMVELTFRNHGGQLILTAPADAEA